MSYSDDKGKYQKAYDFLYKKLVPPSGRAKNALGEALRLVSRVYYRERMMVIVMVIASKMELFLILRKSITRLMGNMSL